MSFPPTYKKVLLIYVGQDHLILGIGESPELGVGNSYLCISPISATKLIGKLLLRLESHFLQL